MIPINIHLPLTALLIKKVDNKLEIRGPKTAEQSKGLEADLVLLLSDYEDMTSNVHVKDMQIFSECTANSILSEAAGRPVQHIRTIAYMLGTVLSYEIPDFIVEGVEYKG